MSYTSYHGKIDGWMSDYELRWLYAQAVITEGFVKGDLLEVGCYKGLSTSALAQAGHVTVIDTFKGSREHTPEEVKDMRKIFEDNMLLARVNLNGLLVIEESSHTALKNLKRKYRLILVDASHEYEDVVQDLKDCKELVSDDGIIVFDDVNWPSVRLAAMEELPGYVVVDSKLGMWINKVSL